MIYFTVKPFVERLTDHRTCASLPSHHLHSLSNTTLLFSTLSIPPLYLPPLPYTVSRTIRSNGRLVRRETTSFWFPLAVRRYEATEEEMLFGNNSLDDDVAGMGGGGGGDDEMSDGESTLSRTLVHPDRHEFSSSAAGPYTLSIILHTSLMNLSYVFGRLTSSFCPLSFSMQKKVLPLKRNFQKEARSQLETAITRIRWKGAF